MALVRPVRVPPTARTYYKVVAVTSAEEFVSIFDGRTKYKLDEVTTPSGGCWVCPDLMAVIQHSNTLPSRSARLRAPRAILQVAGWNRNNIAPPAPPGHGRSTTKLLVTHVMPLAVLPYTAAQQPGARPDQAEFLSNSIGQLSQTARTSGRPISAPAARPPSLTIAPGLANRVLGTAEQAQRLQAQTAGLHEDVMLAEMRLRRLQNVNRVVAPSGEQPEWMRRAVERYAGSNAEPARPHAVRAA